MEERNQELGCARQELEIEKQRHKERKQIKGIEAFKMSAVRQ